MLLDVSHGEVLRAVVDVVEGAQVGEVGGGVLLLDVSLVGERELGADVADAVAEKRQAQEHPQDGHHDLQLVLGHQHT